MNLQERKEILVRLGNYLQAGDEAWQNAKEKASYENAWFIPEFIELSAHQIAKRFLAPQHLNSLIAKYALPHENPAPQKVGIVMAGNIPMVGFHDLLCTFLSGHYAYIKLSSKDKVLMRFLVTKLEEWNGATSVYFTFAEMLKGCDAYIATGSNNSSTYFSYYFNKYPNIIRKNRTSVAVLDGQETSAELESLADDVYQYFGLGCRNVTQLYVPEGYDFEPLINVFKKYNYLADHPKLKNNYDYNLALHLLNKRYYMSNESLLLVEDASPFSAIGQLHYQFYTDKEEVEKKLANNDSIQCVVGKSHVPFGEAQRPGICDYADGVDTMQFLVNLNETPEVRKA